MRACEWTSGNLHVRSLVSASPSPSFSVTSHSLRHSPSFSVSLRRPSPLPVNLRLSPSLSAPVRHSPSLSAILRLFPSVFVIPRLFSPISVSLRQFPPLSVIPRLCPSLPAQVRRWPWLSVDSCVHRRTVRSAPGASCLCAEAQQLVAGSAARCCLRVCPLCPASSTRGLPSDSSPRRTGLRYLPAPREGLGLLPAPVARLSPAGHSPSCRCAASPPTAPGLRTTPAFLLRLPHPQPRALRRAPGLRAPAELPSPGRRGGNSRGQG